MGTPATARLDPTGIRSRSISHAAIARGAATGAARARAAWVSTDA